jgi:Na+/proline symporter
MIQPLDWTLIASIVLVSTCIGIIPKFIEKYQRSRRPNQAKAEDKPPSFFMNSVSFAISFQTIITSLGVPAEFYYYGLKTYQYSLIMILPPIVIATVCVPFLHKLKSKSLYDYLTDKFEGSLAVQNFTLAMALLAQFFFLSIIMFSTGICVMQIVSLVFPVKLWSVLTLIGTLSAFLAILGLKSVIWVNFIQYIAMIACNLLIIVFSIKNYQATTATDSMNSTNSTSSFTANFMEMYNVMERVNMSRVFIFEENFRHRYTMWNCVIGFTFFFVPGYAFTQQSYMRIKSTSSETKAKWLMISVIPFAFLFIFLTVSMGFVAFVYFQRCGNPLESGRIKNQNQILIAFLIQFFSDYSGLLGVFIGVLISSSIGIISNILSALSVTLTHDVIDKFLHKKIEDVTMDGEEMVNLKNTSKVKSPPPPSSGYLKKRDRIMEISAIICSTFLVILIAIGLEYIKGSLTGISVSFLSSAYSSILFVYTCAKFNDYMSNKSQTDSSRVFRLKLKSTHVIISCIGSFLLINFLYIGRLLTMSSAGDFYISDRSTRISNKVAMTPELEVFCHASAGNFTQLPSIVKPKLNSSANSITFLNYLFGISFAWYACIGFFCCVFVISLLNVFKLIGSRKRLVKNQIEA